MIWSYFFRFFLVILLARMLIVTCHTYCCHAPGLRSLISLQLCKSTELYWTQLSTWRDSDCTSNELWFCSRSCMDLQLEKKKKKNLVMNKGIIQVHMVIIISPSCFFWPSSALRFWLATEMLVREERGIFMCKSVHLFICFSSGNIPLGLFALMST